MVVFTAFSSLFYYGHQVDWTLPKFSTLVGTETLKVDDWCAAHAVPESQCVECNLDLMPKGTDYGWCQEHGVHNCPLHHPNIAQLKSTPVVSTEDLERAASRPLTLRERKENNSGCKIYRTRIQFASEEAVRQAGVEVELVERQPIRELIPGYGAISYDPTRLASLSSRLPGNAWRVEKNIGDSVQQGEVLVLVDAMQVGEAKTKLLQALAEENLQRQNVQRLEDARGAVAGRQVLEAEAALAKARANVLSAEQSLINLGLPADADSLRGLNEREVMDQLRFLGIPAAIQSRFGPEVATANLLPVQASIDGVVIDRMVAPGEVVDSSRALFRIADTSHMWLTLNLPLEHMDKLSLGQTVRFRPDGSRTEVHGKLDWISTTADRQSRMVQVRAKLSNPGGRLRNETFGAGRVGTPKGAPGNRHPHRCIALGRLLPSRLCTRPRLFRWSGKPQSVPPALGPFGRSEWSVHGSPCRSPAGRGGGHGRQ